MVRARGHQYCAAELPTIFSRYATAEVCSEKSTVVPCPDRSSMLFGQFPQSGRIENVNLAVVESDNATPCHLAERAREGLSRRSDQERHLLAAHGDLRLGALIGRDGPVVHQAQQQTRRSGPHTEASAHNELFFGHQVISCELSQKPHSKLRTVAHRFKECIARDGAKDRGLQGLSRNLVRCPAQDFPEAQDPARTPHPDHNLLTPARVSDQLHLARMDSENRKCGRVMVNHHLVRVVMAGESLMSQLGVLPGGQAGEDLLRGTTIRATIASGTSEPSRHRCPTYVAVDAARGAKPWGVIGASVSERSWSCRGEAPIEGHLIMAVSGARLDS